MTERIRIGDCVYVDARVAEERDQLRQQVEKLLGEVASHKLQVEHAPWVDQKADRRLWDTADQVRKELEGR